MEAGARPVDLISKVHKDGFSMSVFALFDVLLLAFMMSLLSSKFVLAPGVRLGVPPASLPKADGPAIEAALAGESVDVLNVKGEDMMIFDGRIYGADAFSRMMRSRKPSGGVLLIKADAAVSGQTLLDIAAVAGAAGFKSVQVAAEPR